MTPRGIEGLSSQEVRSVPEIIQGNQPVPVPGPGRRCRHHDPVREAVMMFPLLRLRHDIVCQQAVELVTGYLEGTLGAPAVAASRRTSLAARTAPFTSLRCARRSS